MINDVSGLPESIESGQSGHKNAHVILHKAIKQIANEIDGRLSEQKMGEYIDNAMAEVVVNTSAQVDWTGAVALTALTPKWIKARLTGDTILTLAGGTPNEAYSVTLEIIQDATGNRTITYPGVLWAQGVAHTQSPGANDRDLVFLNWNGSNWIGTIGAQKIGAAT